MDEFLHLLLLMTTDTPNDEYGNKNYQQNGNNGKDNSAAVCLFYLIILFLQQVVAKFSIVARQGFSCRMTIERVFQKIEVIELYLGRIGINGPIALIESAMGVNFVVKVSHFREKFSSLFIIRYSFCLSFLAKQCHTQTVQCNGI